MKPILVALGLISLAGCGPSTYEDCVLQNLKGSKDELATRAIMMACEEKYAFKNPAPVSRVLTENELTKVRGMGWTGKSARFSGQFYNGNEAITVTEITVGIERENGEQDSYRIKVNIPPQTTETAGVDVFGAYSPAPNNFVIRTAKGHN